MKIRLVTIFSCLAAVLSAQQYYDDAQVRANLNLEKKISKNFSIQLDQQFRFTNNASELSRWKGDIGLVWKVNKNVRFLFDYVMVQRKNDLGYFRQQNWYYVAGVFRKEFGYWKLIYRNMLQARFGNVNSEAQNLARLYDRNKLTLRYEASKRINLYTAGEIYIPLNNPQLQGIERVRGQVGMVFTVMKNHQLEFYFMYQQRLRYGDWWDQYDRYPRLLLRRDYIYGIGYAIEF